jgi:hypothetical protein
MINKTEELAEISRRIVIALDGDSIHMTEEDKESMTQIIESLDFFTKEGDLDRAIREGNSLIKKLSEINK